MKICMMETHKNANDPFTKPDEKDDCATRNNNNNNNNNKKTMMETMIMV